MRGWSSNRAAGSAVIDADIRGSPHCALKSLSVVYPLVPGRWAVVDVFSATAARMSALRAFSSIFALMDIDGRPGSWCFPHGCGRSPVTWRTVDSRLCVIRRSAAWPAGGARRSTKTPRALRCPPPSPTPPGHRPPRGGRWRRAEVDGEAGVGPLCEPRRNRRKQQHHSEELGPRELYPEVGGEAEVGERLRHLWKAKLRVGREATCRQKCAVTIQKPMKDTHCAGHWGKKGSTSVEVRGCQPAQRTVSPQPKRGNGRGGTNRVGDRRRS